MANGSNGFTIDIKEEEINKWKVSKPIKFIAMGVVNQNKATRELKETVEKMQLKDSLIQTEISQNRERIDDVGDGLTFLGRIVYSLTSLALFIVGCLCVLYYCNKFSFNIYIFIAMFSAFVTSIVSIWKR